MGNNGIHVVVAAIILGASLLGGAYLISNAIDDMSDQIPRLEAALNTVQQGIAGGAPAAAPAPARHRGPDPNKVYTVASAGAPVRGPADAKVTVVEFSDFQCPFCGRAAPTLDRLQKEYPKDVRVVYKHLPLSFHRNAQGAAEAAEAAHRQGKFWEMHDKLFSQQRDLSEQKYVEWAGEIGLDVDKFKTDMKSKAVLDRINKDKQEAAALGVSGTPGFFINGRFLSGAKPYAEFKAMVDRELGKS